MTTELDVITDRLFRVGRDTGRFFFGNFVDDVKKGFADWGEKSNSERFFDVVKFNIGSGWPVIYNLYFKMSQHYDLLPRIAPLARTAKSVMHDILHHPLSELGKHSIEIDSNFY